MNDFFVILTEAMWWFLINVDCHRQVSHLQTIVERDCWKLIDLLFRGKFVCGMISS